MSGNSSSSKAWDVNICYNMIGDYNGKTIIKSGWSDSLMQVMIL